jgi:hypothetical protein
MGGETRGWLVASGPAATRAKRLGRPRVLVQRARDPPHEGECLASGPWSGRFLAALGYPKQSWAVLFLWTGLVNSFQLFQRLSKYQTDSKL